MAHIPRGCSGSDRKKFIKASDGGKPVRTQPLRANCHGPEYYDDKERGSSMRFGAECCSRTTAIQHRFAGVALDSKLTRHDIDDVVAASGKVCPAVGRG